MLQFVCDVVKDTGKEEYLLPYFRIGLDWTVDMLWLNFSKFGVQNKVPEGSTFILVIFE